MHGNSGTFSEMTVDILSALQHAPHDEVAPAGATRFGAAPEHMVLFYRLVQHGHVDESNVSPRLSLNRR